MPLDPNFEKFLLAGLCARKFIRLPNASNFLGSQKKRPSPYILATRRNAHERRELVYACRNHRGSKRAERQKTSRTDGGTHRLFSGTLNGPTTK